MDESLTHDITSILNTEPRYADKTIITREDVDEDSRQIASWAFEAGDQAIKDDRFKNAAKAILAKKLVEALLYVHQEYIKDIGYGYPMAEQALAEWRELTKEE